MSCCCNNIVTIPFHPFNLRHPRHGGEPRHQNWETLQELSKVLGAGIAASARTIRAATHTVNFRTGFKVMLIFLLIFSLSAVAVANAAQPNPTRNQVQIQRTPFTTNASRDFVKEGILPMPVNVCDLVGDWCEDNMCRLAVAEEKPIAPMLPQLRSIMWHLNTIAQIHTFGSNEREKIEALLHAVKNLQIDHLIQDIQEVVKPMGDLALIEVLEHAWMIVNLNLDEGAYAEEQTDSAIQCWRDLTQLTRSYRIAHIAGNDAHLPFSRYISEAIRKTYRYDWDGVERAYRRLILWPERSDELQRVQFYTAAHIVDVAVKRLAFDPRHPDKTQDVRNIKKRPLVRIKIDGTWRDRASSAGA